MYYNNYQQPANLNYNDNYNNTNFSNINSNMWQSPQPNNYQTAQQLQQQKQFEMRQVMSLDEAKFAQVNGNPLLLFDNNNNSIYLKEIANDGSLIFKAYKEFKPVDTDSNITNQSAEVMAKVNKLESNLQQVMSQYNKIAKDLGLVEDKKNE